MHGIQIFLSALTGSIIFSPLQLNCRSTPNQKADFLISQTLQTKRSKHVTAQLLRVKSGQKILSFKTFICLSKILFLLAGGQSWAKHFSFQANLENLCNAFFARLKPVSLRYFLFPGQVHIAITASVGCCMCYCDAQYIFMNNVSRP